MTGPSTSSLASAVEIVMLSPAEAYALPGSTFIRCMYQPHYPNDYRFLPHVYHVAYFGTVPVARREEVKKVWARVEPYLSEAEMDERLAGWKVEIGTSMTLPFAEV